MVWYCKEKQPEMKSQSEMCVHMSSMTRKWLRIRMTRKRYLVVFMATRNCFMITSISDHNLNTSWNIENYLCFKDHQRKYVAYKIFMVLTIWMNFRWIFLDWVYMPLLITEWRKNIPCVGRKKGVTKRYRHIKYVVAKSVILSLLAEWRPCRVNPEIIAVLKQWSTDFILISPSHSSALQPPFYLGCYTH